MEVYWGGVDLVGVVLGENVLVDCLRKRDIGEEEWV